MLYFYKDFGLVTQQQKNVYHNLLNLLFYLIKFTGTGIYLTILLQVFNWFPVRLLHQIMALWVMMQSFGYITWILFDRNVNWIKMLVVGPIFLALAFFDYFYFRMYPTQENIFVEDSYYRTKEKEVFDKMNVECKLRESMQKKISVFDLQADAELN